VPSDWSLPEAIDAANQEFDAVEIDYLFDGFEDDPEGSADASSYWSDGA
jgi:hypothetical protein